MLIDLIINKLDAHYTKMQSVWLRISFIWVHKYNCDKTVNRTWGGGELEGSDILLCCWGKNNENSSESYYENYKGSLLASNCLKMYNFLSDEGFMFFQSIILLLLSTLLSSQGLWSSIRRWLHWTHKCKNLFNSYLFEFLHWKQKGSIIWQKFKCGKNTIICKIYEM